MRKLQIYLFVVLTLICFAKKGATQVSAGTIRQLSVGVNNTIPAGVSGSPSLASNGQYLVFNSTASNLVSGDSNNAKDVFLNQLSNGALSRVSVSTSGVQGNDDSGNPVVSPAGPDGFFAVAFESDASNLSSFSDALGNRDIFVRIPSLGVTEAVTLAPGPVFADGNSRSPSITTLTAPNKILIAFESDATNLVVGDTNLHTDIFLASFEVPAVFNTTNFITALKIIRISSGAQQSNGDSSDAKISGDGSTITFSSDATNLITGVTTSGTQVFSYNVASGQISLISKDVSGLSGNADSTSATLSYTGRFITYISKASNIVSGAAQNKAALVLYDSLKGTTQRVNTSVDGIAGTGSVNGANISANGRTVTFSDSSNNLVPGDSNNLREVFVKDLFSGQIARVSIGESGNQGNGASDLPTIAGSGYNSLSGITAYRSFATNFTTAGLSSGSDIFANTTTLLPRVLGKASLLEVPPDVVVTNKTALLSFEKLSEITKAALTGGIVSRAKSIPVTVQYDIRITKVGGKSKDNIKKIAKKVQVTLKKLKPGTYTSKYRAMSVRGTKTISATKFSPVQKFTVVK